MNQQNYTLITGLLFSLIAVGHVYRSFTGGAIVFGTVSIPLWASWLGIVIAGFLAFWAFRLVSATGDS